MIRTTSLPRAFDARKAQVAAVSREEQRRRTEADIAQATWTLGAANGQPFLISTEHPEAVTAEQELGAKGGMIMGGLFAALALLIA